MDLEQANTMQLNAMLQMAGVTTANGGMNWGNIIANLIFGVIGTVALMYGWKNKSPKPLVIGIAMSIFPFFVSNTILVFMIGFGLTALLYFWRD